MVASRNTVLFPPTVGRFSSSKSHGVIYLAADEPLGGGSIKVFSSAFLARCCRIKCSSAGTFPGLGREGTRPGPDAIFFELAVLSAPGISGRGFKFRLFFSASTRSFVIFTRIGVESLPIRLRSRPGPCDETFFQISSMLAV